jgi:UDPglucose--hexose-1-phosphate uridylyltransferase
MIDSYDQPHRRYNPLLDEWVLVSPHRTKRPWLGQKETVPPENRPQHDKTCYLCPGNTRANGEVNPSYEDTYVFINDFAALLPREEGAKPLSTGLLVSEPAGGECRVICFSPRHDLSLAEMETTAIRRVVDMWADQITDLGSRLKWVQIFENKGAGMGASNPHPHGQVWACDFLPSLVAKEDSCQKAYFHTHGKPMLLDLVQQELVAEERVVASTEHWLLVVPFWATWPFEYLLLPRRHVRRLPELTDLERDDLSSILKIGIQAYDQLFETSFPYSMGWHGAPTDGEEHPEWQLHAHFYPPLLRSATIRKFMVGFELLAEAQRDVTPEGSAARLRAIVTR